MPASRPRGWSRGIALALLLGSAAGGGRAEVVLESAVLGPTGQLGGTSVTSQQLVGWRFQLASDLRVSAIGGHLLGFDVPGESGPIFAALVRLSALDAFPQGDPFLPGEIVASAVFSPPFPSADVSVPLDVALAPGSYALVFGSGQLGATGGGALPNPPEQLDIPPTTIDSYIFYSVPQPGDPAVWRGPLASNMRFVVRGELDTDGDGIADPVDRCPFLASPDQTDTDGDGRGDRCECGDQDGDGRNTVLDLVAINAAIFQPALATPLCDANGDGQCNVLDVVAANAEIFSPGSTSTCAAQPVPGP
jgi:hypothetical protein